MADQKIIELYFARSEDAIRETDAKYGRYCHSVAYNVLHSHEDAEECVNDTYIRAWDSIPPKKPIRLSTFLAKITRNLALDRLDYYNAEKRPQDTVSLIEELGECTSSGDDILDEIALRDAINSFLAGLKRRTRIVFMQRYWYFRPIADIARDIGTSESSVKVILHRARKDLRAHLETYGFYVN